MIELFAGWYFVVVASTADLPGHEVVWAARCVSQEECQTAVDEIAPAIRTINLVNTRAFCSQDPKYGELSYPDIDTFKRALRPRT